MKRAGILAYGVVCYAFFFATFLYMVGFLGNIVVPVTIDGEPTLPFWLAGLVNLGLVLLFGLQHSVMARPTFKKWWTQIIPEPAERATYVLLTSVVLAVMFLFWQPMGVSIWNIENPAGRAVLYALFAAGWLTILGSSFLINHFDLFGLRQVWLYFRGKDYTRLRFGEPGVYRYVRHPLYVGWFLTFWATPTMTLAHLTFAVGLTAYILVAIFFEERNLAEEHGEAYLEWRSRTPMFVPRLGGRRPVIAASKVAAV